MTAVCKQLYSAARPVHCCAGGHGKQSPKKAIATYITVNRRGLGRVTTKGRLKSRHL